MNNYEFSKLNNEEKWQERKEVWAIDRPEEYIRLLIINDELTLLKKYDKESIHCNFNYKIKDEILLTLAMEKNCYQMINYLLEKGLTIKERDIIGLAKNYRKEDQTKEFRSVLDKIDFSNFDYNKILNELSEYFYDDNLIEFLDYGINLNMKIDKEIIEKMKENDSLIYIVDKYTKKEAFELMSKNFAHKKTMKANKI